jgi:hypothetical protein
VWDAVSSLLTDPATLRQDLQAMIVRERKAHGDPKAEAKAWAEKQVELELKRDKYQEMIGRRAAAAGGTTANGPKAWRKNVGKSGQRN